MRSEVEAEALGVSQGWHEAESFGFQNCRERLAASDVPSRVRAARELPEWGEAAVEPLVAALVTPEPKVRLAVIEALGKTGSPTAVEPLVAVLRDRNLLARAAAARALGEIGDPRAIPALREALRDCFMARSAQTQRSVGVMLVPLVVLLQLWLAWTGVSSELRDAYTLSLLAACGWCLYSSRRRPYSPVCQACVTSLTQLVECSPRTDLQQLVPELRAVAGNLFLQDRETRKAANQAILRLGALTAALSQLPVPAGAPAADLSTLPQPAARPLTVAGHPEH